MKNVTAILSFGLIILATIGCGYFQSSSKSKNGANENKSIIEQVSETVGGTEKTGIPECDAVLVKIEKSQQANDDSIASQAKREFIKQTIYSQVRGGLGNKTPEEKKQIAEVCKQIGANFLQQTETETKK